MVFVSVAVDSNKLRIGFLDLEEQEATPSQEYFVPELVTNIRNTTCVLDSQLSAVFSCAIVNDDQKIYLATFQFDTTIKRINF